MAFAKSASQPVRKLAKVGGHSYSVTIPLSYIRELGWKEKQKVVLTMRGKKITIQDWEK